jgi:hypothetical protein
MDSKQLSTNDENKEFKILESKDSDNPIIKHLYDNFIKIFVLGEKDSND